MISACIVYMRDGSMHLNCLRSYAGSLRAGAIPRRGPGQCEPGVSADRFCTDTLLRGREDAGPCACENCAPKWASRVPCGSGAGKLPSHGQTSAFFPQRRLLWTLEGTPIPTSLQACMTLRSAAGMVLFLPVLCRDCDTMFTCFWPFSLIALHKSYTMSVALPGTRAHSMVERRRSPFYSSLCGRDTLQGNLRAGQPPAVSRVCQHWKAGACRGRQLQLER